MARTTTRIGTAVAIGLPLLVLSVFHNGLFGGGDPLQIVQQRPTRERGIKFVTVYAPRQLPETELIAFAASRFSPRHDENRARVDVMFSTSKRDALYLDAGSIFTTVCLDPDREPVARSGFAPCNDAVRHIFDREG